MLGVVLLEIGQCYVKSNLHTRSHLDLEGIREQLYGHKQLAHGGQDFPYLICLSMC